MRIWKTMCTIMMTRENEYLQNYVYYNELTRENENLQDYVYYNELTRENLQHYVNLQDYDYCTIMS